MVDPTRGEIPLQVANFSDQPQRLYQEAKIGTCEVVKKVHDSKYTTTTDKLVVNCPNDPLDAKAASGESHTDQCATPKVPEHMMTLVDEEILDNNRFETAVEMLIELIPMLPKSKDNLTITDCDVHSMKIKSGKTMKQGLR